MWTKILSDREKERIPNWQILELIYKGGHYEELSERCRFYGGTNGNTPRAIAGAYRAFERYNMTSAQKVEELRKCVKIGLLPY